MTKMAATLYCKTFFKISFFRTRRLMTLGLGILCKAYQLCSNDDPRLTLTDIMTRQICFKIYHNGKNL